ncbi:MAG: alpha-E domain-containing protein [Pseudomonadaceae bacterium]|nr:alpha-E domain-containing protein [Pseudomonadaceae bacterium]
MNRQTLSKTAERAYWLGRYLERAENTARLLANESDLAFELGRSDDEGWHRLLTITGSADAFADSYDVPSRRNVIKYMTTDATNPSSIVATLHAARENARTIREVMPVVTFEYVNDLWRESKSSLSGNLSARRLASALREQRERTEQLEGFLSANMLHDAPWNFLRIGCFLERADMTSRIIDNGVVGVRQLDLVSQQVRLRGALKAMTALQNYSAEVGQPISRAGVLKFLLGSTSLPRSVTRCVNSLRRSLGDLPRHDKAMKTVNSLRRKLAQEDASELAGPELSAYIDEIQQMIGITHNAISDTYFHFKPRLRRASRSPKKTAKKEIT